MKDSDAPELYEQHAAVNQRGESQTRVVVTGAASGIGLAVVQRYQTQGSLVAGIDIASSASIDDLTLIHADLTDEAAVEASIDRAAADLGGIDVLVVCAGVNSRGTVEETSAEEWDRVFAINVRAPYLCAKYALKYLRDGVDPSIVNVSSQFAMVATAGYAAYCSSKAALVHLTRAMAVDHGPEGVRVNAVCPGPTDTPMLREDLAKGGEFARGVETVLARTLVGRASSPHEIADVIAYVASPGAAAMHGAVLAADGGYSIH